MENINVDHILGQWPRAKLRSIVYISEILNVSNLKVKKILSSYHDRFEGYLFGDFNNNINDRTCQYFVLNQFHMSLYYQRLYIYL
jgi:hypothetical protein